MTDGYQNDAEIMEQSLFIVVEADVDITERLYAQFFAAHPEQKASFFHPTTTKGQMVNEILECLLALAQGEQWVENSIQNHVIAHRSYGDIPFRLYAELLDMLVTCLAEISGKCWSTQYQAAWDRQTARLIRMVADDF
ncbi:MAG: hypothetical protein V7676_14175 [Parasphingorhabdus sp.]|uniref:hypothetical protein n=1 Tax=Parasphingorhabdus sp. TaxID=2709688 RepID=UPI0030033ED2